MYPLDDTVLLINMINVHYTGTSKTGDGTEEELWHFPLTLIPSATHKSNVSLAFGKESSFSLNTDKASLHSLPLISSLLSSCLAFYELFPFYH